MFWIVIQLLLNTMFTNHIHCPVRIALVIPDNGQWGCKYSISPSLWMLYCLYNVDENHRLFFLNIINIMWMLYWVLTICTYYACILIQNIQNILLLQVTAFIDDYWFIDSVAETNRCLKTIIHNAYSTIEWSITCHRYM